MTAALLRVIDELAAPLENLFQEIGDASRDGAGITRDAFGARETKAGAILIDYASRNGLAAQFDRTGTLNVTAAGRQDSPPEILIASHLDSVPRGGNFDGLAGVIAGIAAATALGRIGLPAGRNLRVLGFRGEESPWFGTAYLGSRLFAGQITQGELNALRRFDTGKSLSQHMQDLGLSPETMGLEPLLPLGEVRAYLELHIEQAPLLESLGCPLGLATAIRGNIRYPFAKCFGEYAHSGAVPRRLRADAVIATAKLIVAADVLWRDLVEAGNDDLVFTCGIFQTDAAEHAMTKVPGEVTFVLNVGGTKNDVMEQLHSAIMAKADELAREHKVRFAFGQRIGTPAVALDAALARTIAAAGDEIGIPLQRMPTVGHDAAIFARLGISTSVLLVRNANGSHNPAEHMSMADFMLGVKVLAITVVKLADAER